MSKPILSELEYNASDVASAILSQADLSVTNEDLGVTERTADFSVKAGWTTSQMYIFSFNGFMFFSGSFNHSAGDPTGNEVFLTNTNSATRPSNNMHLSAIGYEGDTANYVYVDPSGNVGVSSPSMSGITGYYLTVNGWYRF